MNTIQTEVNGMTCDHCVNAVTNALNRISGVSDATVDLDENAATVQGEDIDIEALFDAIEEEGYEAALR